MISSLFSRNRYLWPLLATVTSIHNRFDILSPVDMVRWARVEVVDTI